MFHSSHWANETHDRLLDADAEREQARLAAVAAQAEREAIEAEEIRQQLDDPEIFARLTAKKNFGTYQVDMVRMFRKIIQEVDEDGSGEIDKSEFMEAIERMHEHELELPGTAGAEGRGAADNGSALAGLSRKSTFAELASKRSKNTDMVQRMVDSMFHSLDGDGSGTVSVPEMVGVLFPKAADQTKRDIILYLMMAATPVPSEEDEEMEAYERPIAPDVLEELRFLFDIYDVDKSGALTVDELHNAMSSAFMFEPAKNEGVSSKAAAITTTDFERIVQGADMDGDNVIDFEEFCGMMRHFFEED
jgi:Ca2+-binding EF-hand superfamily protein